ncbi:MAG: FtsW/RodA/SpoVE family cell cycle protein [Herpetosiphonaceae bacterium]|nr:FtsW/RodA/SpoVE family cell cycle protein [Herpetosiphonaceae bacterium]
MLQNMRRIRFVELQLLITALLFFASGYVLTAAARPGSAFTRTAQGLLQLLWPSSLPLLMFVAISFILSWRLPRADQLLLPLVAVLAGLGLLLMARFQPSFKAQGLLTRYGKVADKQTVFVTMGVALLLFMALAPLDRLFIRMQRMSLMDWLKNHRWVWMVIVLLMVAITFVFGEGPPGQDQKLWIDLKVFQFQPSELLKLALVIFMASYLDEYREVVAHGYQIGRITLPPLPHLVPMVGMWGLTMVFIFVQKDLGSALLLFGIFLAMLYAATGKGWYVVVGMLAFAGGSYGLYRVIPRVGERVADWLNPWAQAATSGYQEVQAQYALSAGGVFGTGLGQGSPTIVPAIHTDFIFAAVGEELGQAGALAVLLLFILLMYRGYHIAVSLNGRFRGFEQLFAVGLTSIIAFQAFIIIGGVLRVIPLTGVTLPFLSYGGSSILINFLIIGLLLRISAGRSA